MRSEIISDVLRKIFDCKEEGICILTRQEMFRLKCHRYSLDSKKDPQGNIISVMGVILEVCD